MFLQSRILAAKFTIPALSVIFPLAARTAMELYVNVRSKPEVPDGRSKGRHAERRIGSPARRTPALRSAVGRIASKTVSQCRRAVGGSPAEETQAACQGPDLRAGARRLCRCLAVRGRVA